MRAAGCVFAEDEAALLRLAATGPRLDALVTRRVAGEPLEHLLGRVEFAGLRLAVGPGVFVPRRRTEFLARLAGDLVRAAGPDAVAVELCCGVAPIAATWLDTFPAGTPHDPVRGVGRSGGEAAGMRVFAADLDPVAAGYALRNLGARATVLTGDLFDALPGDLRGRIDVLAVNTPYVPTDAIATLPPEAREHEPRAALDGGADGLDVQRRLARQAPAWLAPGGYLLVETSERQAPVAAALFTGAGLVARIDTDEELGATVVSGHRAV